METLHNLFLSTIQKNVTFPLVATRLIKQKMEEVGITLTPKQIRHIRRNLEQGNYDNFRIDLSDAQLAQARISDEEKRQERIAIDVGDQQEFDEFYDKMIQQVMLDAMPKISTHLLKAFKSNSKMMHKREQRTRDAFEKNLLKHWRKAIRLLELLLVIAHDTSAEFNEEFRLRASEENDFVFDVLVRIHARGCQVVNEIISLMKGGFADGAHARWRTLHELSVVAMFVAAHGQETAERYLLHDFIQSYKSAKQHRAYRQWIAEEAPSDEDVEELEAARTHLIDRFGQKFCTEYGWAAEAIGKENPNFADIEKDVGLEHERPYYRLASHNVHANTKGIRFRLGLLSHHDILLSGSSVHGLADPGHGAAIALLRITTTLLLTQPNVDRIAICQVLQELEKEIGDEFLAAHNRLLDAEMKE